MSDTIFNPILADAEYFDNILAYFRKSLSIKNRANLLAILEQILYNH